MDKIYRAETSIEIFQKMLHPSDEELMAHIMLDTLADIYLAADAMSETFTHSPRAVRSTI